MELPVAIHGHCVCLRGPSRQRIRWASDEAINETFTLSVPYIVNTWPIEPYQEVILLWAGVGEEEGNSSSRCCCSSSRTTNNSVPK